MPHRETVGWEAVGVTAGSSCAACGAEQDDGAIFCAGCGEMLVGSSPSSSAPTTTTQIIPGAVPPPPTAGVPAPPAPLAPVRPKATPPAPTATPSPAAPVPQVSRVAAPRTVAPAAPAPVAAAPAPAPAAPPSPTRTSSSSRTPWLVAVGVVIVLALGVGIGSVMAKGDNSTGTSDGAPSSIDESASGDLGGSADGEAYAEGQDVRIRDTTTSTSTTTTLVVTTTTDPEQGALDTLNRQIQADLGRADASVIDTWVPQVSSKRLGITDEETGITYSTYQSILDDFRLSQQRHGDVLLIESGAFSTFSQGGLYVTVSASGFPTAEGANGWCDSHGISPNNCFAKLLSHTTPSGPDAQEYRK